MLALPFAQGFSDYPCDTGSSIPKLTEEFKGKVDLSLLDDDLNSNKGKWSPHCDAIDARARETRRFNGSWVETGCGRTTWTVTL